MSSRPLALFCCLWVAVSVPAAEPAVAKPAKTKITPGKVVIPFDAMRRVWGELVSLDLATRTGSFRKEGDDAIMPFVVMPYAELLHHATLGDLQDFRIGERALFRLHEDDKGDWRLLTYIQDEMNMMNGHGEYYLVDSIDPTKQTVTTTWAKGDMTFIREKDVLIETDASTRFWKAGAASSFSEIKVGDKLRTKTHGLGKGVRRVAWEVFLDDASLQKFQSEQLALQKARIAQEGAAGFVDSVGGPSGSGLLVAGLQLTLFQDGESLLLPLKAGAKVRLTPAGVDRRPMGSAVTGELTSIKRQGKTFVASVTTRVEDTQGFKPQGLMRLWLAGE
jgi:hypothetical protein